MLQYDTIKQMGKKMKKVREYRGLKLVRYIFEKWVIVAEFLEIEPQNLTNWKKRDSVPAKHRAKIVEEAAKRGFDITEQQLRSLK